MKLVAKKSGGFARTPTVELKGKEGLYLIGTILGTRAIETKFGPATIYQFSIEDTDAPTFVSTQGRRTESAVNPGDTVEMFVNKSLASQLAQAAVGTKVKIVCSERYRLPTGNYGAAYDVETI